MRNNQFKSFVSKYIANKCKKTAQSIVISIDETKSTRMYYVYNVKFKLLASISIWTGENNISLKSLISSNKIVNINNKQTDISVNYTEFDKIIQEIDKIFQTIKVIGKE